MTRLKQLARHWTIAQAKAVARVTVRKGAVGAIVVAAGGNAGDEMNLYPAAYRGVISVGAVTIGDAKANFSNYGRSITISAPGAQIYSTAIGGRCISESGPSLATPACRHQRR